MHFYTKEDYGDSIERVSFEARKDCYVTSNQTEHEGTDHKSDLDEVAQKKLGQDVEPGGTTCNETWLINRDEYSWTDY